MPIKEIIPRGRRKITKNFRTGRDVLCLEWRIKRKWTMKGGEDNDDDDDEGDGTAKNDDNG